MTAAHFERVDMTRDELIKEAATAAAQRVDDSVGLDPVTIITILTQVLPLVISCFKRNDEPQAEDIQNAVKQQMATNPERLRRRTMRRIKSESDEPMTRSQAFALADAVIEEALNQNPQMVASVCAVVSDAEFGE